MSSRPASPPPVNPWPFIAGAVLLVILGGIALIGSGTPFPPLALIVALVCFGSGIMVGVAPWALDQERRVRVAEAAVREGADAQLRRLQQTADQLAHVVSRGQSTEEQAGQALGTLEEVAERLVSQADELASALARADTRERTAQAEELQRVIDERDQKLTALEVRLNATSSALTDTQAAIKKSSLGTSRAIETLATRLEEVAEEIREALAARNATPAAPAPASAPAPVVVSAPGSESPQPGVVPEPVDAEAAPEVSPAEEPVEEAQPEPSPEPSPAAPVSEEPLHRPVRRPRAPAVGKPIEPPEPVAPPVAVAPAPEPEPAPSPALTPARPTAPLELALEGMPEPRPVMRLNRREPPGSTSLVATAYIGIGNKLFVRGDGPGLSWEQGVPMQFLAIGKWGWTTTEAAAPVTCRVYRNDEAPMLEADIIIDPGTKVEVTPRF